MSTNYMINRCSTVFKELKSAMGSIDKSKCSFSGFEVINTNLEFLNKFSHVINKRDLSKHEIENALRIYQKFYTELFNNIDYRDANFNYIVNNNSALKTAINDVIKISNALTRGGVVS